MSVRKRLQASSLDAISSHLLLTHQVGVVLRFYQHVITIRFPGDFLLHLVSPVIHNGPRRIVIDPFPDFLVKSMVLGMRVTISKTDILLGDLYVINLKNSHLWTMPPMQKLSQHRQTLLSYIQSRFDLFHQDFPNPLMNELAQVRKKISTFLTQPEPYPLLDLIGLGSGSTPLGDDAILGYLLSQRFVGKPLTKFHHFIQSKTLQTTDLSKEMLLDAYLGNYSEPFLDWLISMQKGNQEELDATIVNLGGNSGWMILESFYQHTIRHLKEDNHEFIFTYTR